MLEFSDSEEFDEWFEEAKKLDPQLQDVAPTRTNTWEYFSDPIKMVAYLEEEYPLRSNL